ncbi:MAG: hypothetical protein HC814_01390 [Rhodobacteraceae bacterium]|nr:hypothetical protein [Paracoccaceae bacterium]
MNNSTWPEDKLKTYSNPRDLMAEVDNLVNPKISSQPYLYSFNFADPLYKKREKSKNPNGEL